MFDEDDRGDVSCAADCEVQLQFKMREFPLSNYIGHFVFDVARYTRGRATSSSSSTIDGMAYREQRMVCNGARSLRNLVRCASTVPMVRNFI